MRIFIFVIIPLGATPVRSNGHNSTRIIHHFRDEPSFEADISKNPVYLILLAYKSKAFV